MGSFSAWCPVREVIEQYNSSIRREIERCLEHIKTDGSSFLIRLCMVGRKGEKVNPTIMIFANQETSKIFEASLSRSGILDRNPEFQLSFSTIPPEAPPIPLKSERRARRPDSSTANRSGLQTSSRHRSDIPGPRMGRKLEHVVYSEAESSVQYTTGGLIVKIGDGFYQITSFGPMGATKEWTSHRDLKESEFDSQSDPDNLGYNQDFTSEKSLLEKKRVRRDRAPYRHGQHPLSSITPYPCEAVCSPPPAYDGRIETSLVWKDQGISSMKPIVMKPTSSSQRQSSHYTLVKLTDLESDEACNVVIRDGSNVPRGIDVVEVAKVGPEAVSVLVVTCRGPIPGTVLPDMASLRMHGSTHFQTVHAVVFSNPLEPGDCGSAVIDAVNGSCYGHIVLGVDGHVVGYMAPASDTIADMVLRFGNLPSLQLDRGTDLKQPETVERWKCVTPRWNPNCRPLAPLGQCTSCSSGKLYSARSRAAAHLRRRHFREQSASRKENIEWKCHVRNNRLPTIELKEWTKEITVTPLYAQVMQAESDSDSDYENDVYETDDEPESGSPSTPPGLDVTDRQTGLERDNEDLRRHNERMKHEVEVLEGDVDVLMEDRDELKQELEYLRRKLSERDAQLVEAQLDAMLQTGYERAKDVAVLDGIEL